VGRGRILRDPSVWVVAAGLLASAGAIVVLAAGDRTTAAGRTSPPVPAPTATAAPGELGAGPLVGEVIPALALVSLDGRALSTAPRGRPLALALWSSTCSCDAVFDIANELEVMAADLAVIGISFDTDIATAAQTAFAAGLLFPSALDRNGEIQATLGYPAPGVLLVVAPDGTVAGEFDASAGTADVVRFTEARFR
jgi:hypothetical protein